MDTWIVDRSECWGLEDIYNISLPMIGEDGWHYCV